MLVKPVLIRTFCGLVCLLLAGALGLPARLTAARLELPSALEAAATSPYWDVECASCPKDYFDLGDRALALDALDRPHIVYAGDALYYAYWDGARWQVETVDQAPGSAGVYTSAASIAVDSAGRPHISYQSADDKQLRYAVRDQGGWQVQVVETTLPGRTMYYDSYPFYRQL